MQKEIEIIKDGLSYNEELECIAKRFGMTQEQALKTIVEEVYNSCLLYTSPSPRDISGSRMPSSA